MIMLNYLLFQNYLKRKVIHEDLTGILGAKFGQKNHQIRSNSLTKTEQSTKLHST